MTKTFTEKEIDTTIDVLDIVREEAIKDKRYAFDDGWVLFMKKEAMFPHLFLCSSPKRFNS